MAKFVLTAQIALQAPRNVGQVVNQIKRQLQGINVNINVNANTRALNNVNNQLNTTAKAAKTAQNSISELGKSLGLAARRFGAIAIATGTFLSLSRAIKSSLGDAIEFERQLVNLSQVTGKSVQNLQDITKEITRLSTGLGVSSDQLLKTSIILAQAGLEASKTKAALEVLAKTELASSFDNITNTTEGAIAILSQFRKEAAAAGGDVIYLERALGAINDVSKKFAVESADLVAVIRRSGGAFEAAGGSLNELLALFTSVRATTRESAETIATGLRTIFTRIQRVDTIRQLQELGIALQDAEGKFVGPFEAIKRISEGLSGLDPRDFRFSAIVEELGGFRQIGKVIPLIKQFALAQDALNTAQGASSSLTKDAEIAQLSLANQLAKVREEFQALIRRFVDSGSFQTVARGALEFARALIRIADAISPLIPLIASLAAIQIGKGFIPALGALTGVAKRNQGGKIHAFASGGFVPGTGNRDTVPAMLTPGEFVIRKNSAKKIGAETLQGLNKGGSVKDLLSTKKSLRSRYDVGDTKEKINDKYSPVKIMRKRLDLDYKSSREKAENIFNEAKKIRNENLEKYKDPQRALNEANEFIQKETGGLSQPLGKEFDNNTNRSYNKIAGALAEKKTKQLYRKAGANLKRIEDTDGADFYNPKSREYIEVKNKISRTDDKELIAKALLAESRDDRKKYKNNQPDTISGMKIRLLTTNEKDIDKKNLGGIIQKFAGGGIVDVLTGQESVAALMMTDASPGQTRIPIKYPDDLKSALESRKQGSESITRGNKLLNSIKLDQYGLNKSAGSDFAARLRENLTNGAASAVNQTVGQMAPTFSGLGIQADFKNLIPGEKVKSAISGGVIGTLFESIIDNLSNQSKDVKDSSFFDFVGPLSDNATKLFEKSESVNNSTYKDAKIQIKAKNIESKIINQASQELGLGTNVQSTGQIQTAQDYIDKLTRAGLYEQFKTTGISFAKLSQAGIKGANKEAALAMLQDKFGVDRIGYRDYQLNQKDPTTGQPRIGRDFFLKYAKGGIASSDTVPALLTPGEFVVNKKTAQEVGYGALNRMNKTGDVQGFAKGGPVGVQRFAIGGPVQPGPLNVSSQGPPTASMAALAQTFDKLAQQGGGMVTSFNLLKSAVEEMQAAGVKFTAAEKAAIKQMADDARKKAAAEKTQIDSYAKLQKSQQEAKDKFTNLKSGIEKTLGSMQQFVFLGTTVAALATQFSSLDEATNSAITETLGMGASIVGVIGTVGDLILSTGLADTALKYFTASVTRAGTAAAASSAAGAAGKAGGGAVGGAGLLSRLIPMLANPYIAVAALVVAALTSFAAYIYFIQARARKVAEGLRKSADTIADSIEKGKGGSTQEFVDLQVKAAQTVTDSYLTFAGLLDAAGMTSAKARQEEVNAVKRSAEAYIGVVQSISDVNKSIANIDLDKTLKPAEAAFKKIAAIDTGVRSQTGVLSGPSSQFQEIAKLAEREGIRKPVSQITEADFSSDTAKAQFKLANDAITKVTEDFEKRIPESISLLQTQLEDSLQSVNFGQAAKIDLNNDNIIDSFDTVLQQNQDFANSVNTVIKLIQIEAQARADAARQAGKFVEAGNIEADAQERVKVVQEAIQKQAVAFAKSQESALAFQAALEASTAQFKGLSATTQFISKLGDQAKQFGNRISTLGDIMSGEMPTFEVDQIQGLGNLSEIQDLDKFTQEVGKLGASMGPKGKELAGNLIQSADLMQNAKRELTGINFAEIGGGEESAAKTAFKKAFGDQLDTIFGPQVGGKLRTVMEKRLEDAIRTASEGGGMVDPAELENILDPLKQMTEETRKMFEAYNNAQIEFVNQYNNTSKMLLEVMERDIDGRQKIVDIQNRGLERMDQATGRTPGFQEKEARRNASRGSRLGALGLGVLTGDIRGMGNALRDTNQKLEVNSQKIKQDPGNEVLGRSQRLLTLQANELKKALEDLTDQSDKASDIMGEIDKERGKRETLTKIVEDFVVGNNEERMSTVRQFQGIEFAAATGSLQGLQPEDRKATFGLLSQLADVDDGFKQLKENLVMRDAIAMGLPPELARALATKTPKEEQLLVELSNLTAQEIAAQQELNRINAEFGGKLSREINNLSQKIEKLGSVIESKLNTEVAKATNEQANDKALVESEKAKRAELDKPQALLSAAKTKRESLEDQIKESQIQARGKASEAMYQTSQAREASKGIGGGGYNENRTWSDFGWEVISFQNTSNAMTLKDTALKESERLTNEAMIAAQKVNKLQQELEKIKQEEARAQAEIDQIKKKQEAQTKAKGGLVYRASGGSIFKPKGTDTVPAMLTPGEFVMRKAAVDKYGVDTMSAMNQGVAYASTGGLVKYLQRGGILDDDEETRRRFEDVESGKYGDMRGKLDLSSVVASQSDRNRELEQINTDLGHDRTRGMNLKGKTQRQTGMSLAQYNDLATEEGRQFIRSQNPELAKSFDLTTKRREAEKRKRQIRSGQIDPMAERKAAIQEKLQKRQFNIQSARFNRKQEALPSYMRSETPQNLRSFDDFKRAQGGGNIMQPAMGMGAQAQAMQPQIRGQGMMGAQAVNGGMAQGQGFNMEPLMQLKQTFDNLAGVLNNMQMTHTVNVDGALNINGVDAPQVAEAIKQYLGNFIVTEVNKIINNQGKGFQGQQSK